MVVSRSTRDRRQHIREKIRMSLEVEPTLNPIDFMRIFAMEYPNASTAFAYINTMAYLYPRVKKFPEWRDHYKKYQLAAHQHQAFADQAKILSLEQLRDFKPESPIKITTLETIHFVWITASRFGDLKHMLWIDDAERLIPEHKLVVGLVDMKGSKGDQKGTRGDQKAVIFPQSWRDTIVNSCQRNAKKHTSAYLFKKALKTIDEEMTLHSCRRGAVQTLARLNQPKLGIQELTLHQQQHRLQSRSADTYLNGLWLKDQREQNQIRLQLMLLFHLNLISALTMQYVSREWLPSIHSISQATPLEMPPVL